MICMEEEESRIVEIEGVYSSHQVEVEGGSSCIA